MGLGQGYHYTLSRIWAVNTCLWCAPACRRAKHEADAHHQRHLLAAALAAFQRPLAAKSLAQACLRRLLNRLLAAAFDAWRQRLADSRQLAADAADRGRAVVLRMQSGLLASAFDTWRQHRSRNQQLRQVLLRIQQRHLAAAWNSWRAWAAKMQRARGLMRRQLMGTQQWALAAWREATAAAAEQRWALERVVGAQGQGRSTPKRLVFALQGEQGLALLMGAFAVWQGAAEGQRHLREQVLQAYKHLYFQLARRCFSILR